MVAANRGDESMETSQTAATEKSSLVQDWLGAVRYWLGGRRAVIGLVVLAVGAGLVLNWGWLVAVGIAPLLLALAPCAVMCALGLCMNKMMGGGGSCSSKETVAGEEASQAARPEALPAAAPAPNQLALGLDDSSTAARPALVASAAPEGASGTQTQEEEKIHA
jgi:hypothetical protein